MARLTADGSSIEVLPGCNAFIFKRTLPYAMTLHKAGRKTIICTWVYDIEKDEFDCVLAHSLNEALKEWKGTA